MAAHVRPHPLLSALSRARVARAILSRTEEPWLAALWLRELDEALAAAEAEFCSMAQREPA